MRYARIVRASGFFMLALTSFSPALAAPAARPIESLSPAERMQLPDSTPVTFRSHPPVTLGVLRAEHQRRMMRFAGAAAAGRAFASRAAPRTPVARVTMSGTHPVQIPPGAFATPKASTKPSPIAVVANLAAPVPPPSFLMNNPASPLPKDYVSFCAAAIASGCVYMPGDSTLSDFQDTQVGGGAATVAWLVQSDTLIVSADACAQQGGLWSLGFCQFWYPRDYFFDFNPGTAMWSAVHASSPDCNTMIDPHGALRMTYGTQTMSPYQTLQITGFVACTVTVWVRS